MNITYLDEDLELEYYNYNIDIEISCDYNNIKIECNHKSYSDEVYQYIMTKDEFNKIINNEKKEELTSKNIFDFFNKIFEDKKVIIEYNKKIYTMDLIFKLNDNINNNISLNLNKKFPVELSQLDFKSKPLFKYKEKIFNNNFGSGCNSLFDVYINYLDSKSYLITSNYKNCNIEIILLENKSLIAELKGHKNEILSIRYFFNEITKEEYIISSDINKIVIVWNIHDNFSIDFNIKIDYSQCCHIYSSIIANIQEFNYVITSCYSDFRDFQKKDPKKDYTKMFSLMNKDFIKEVYNTESNNTRYMLSWYNELDKSVYIIELCDYQISINNLLKKQNYCLFHSEYNKEEFITGFIYKTSEKDFLITGSWNGYIRLWDLEEKSQINCLDTDDVGLYNIIFWSKESLICANKFLNKIKVIDIKYFFFIFK